MANILLSWVAKMNDFKDGEVNDDGPNMNLHRHFYDHDHHILLSQAWDDDLQAQMLASKIKQNFPDHKVEIAYMRIEDVIDIHEIKVKVERFIMQHREGNGIDIFWSPGTSMMQLAWYIVHMQGIANTRIIQGRPARFAQPGEPLFFETRFVRSKTPVSIMVKADDRPEDPEAVRDYRISPAIEPVYVRARKIAAVENVTTLIRGESGTGKEHLARFIHAESSRRKKHCVTVNCSAISDDLLESRLFGYEKGAFTGAEQDRAGWFEEANGGTLFLDEIGDISTNMQQSLLRVLQEGEVMRVGANESRKVDVRIIAATHRNLEQMCMDGTFRWDLYYRLAVTELELPSLRARGKKEIGDMMDFFLDTKARKFGKRRLQLDGPSTSLVLSYQYPGNLREMENIVENLYVFSDREVKLEDFPRRMFEKRLSESFLLKDVEAQHIEKVLQYFDGNMSQTCRALGIALNTLKSKMREYGLGKFA
ncbi:MAG: sigma-54 dependent transcriptional regulator [Bacteroidota bacterium]